MGYINGDGVIIFVCVQYNRGYVGVKRGERKQRMQCVERVVGGGKRNRESYWFEFQWSMYVVN